MIVYISHIPVNMQLKILPIVDGSLYLAPFIDIDLNGRLQIRNFEKRDPLSST